MDSSRKSGIPLADWLSIDRVLLTGLLLVVSYNQVWTTAVVVFGLAWFTDLLDGWVARRYGSLRDDHPNLDMDGICDSILAFGSSLVVVVYAWFHYNPAIHWLLIGLWVLTLVSGATMAAAMNRPLTARLQWLIAINMIVFHGIVQILGTAAWFAYMAFGTSGVVATLVVALPVAWLQRRKMRLWLAGKFA